MEMFFDKLCTLHLKLRTYVKLNCFDMELFFVIETVYLRPKLNYSM